MELSDVAERTYHTGYRSSFMFRLGPDEQPWDLLRGYLRTWLARISPTDTSTVGWDGVSELSLFGGVFAQGVYDREASSGAFRAFLPESLALADSGESAEVGVPGKVRNRAAGEQQRFHRVTVYVFPATLHDRPAAHVLIQGATDDDSILEAIDEYEVPSFVGSILRERTCFDGDTRLLADPEMLGHKGVKRALDAILDPERSISVVVAASPVPEGDEAFLEANRSLLRRSLGTATGYVLQASAVETFNRRFPPHLRVPSGDVRTFLPHADIRETVPGARHRYVGPETLAASLDENHQVRGYLPTLHARLPRRQMLEQPLGEELLSLRAQVDRQARRGRISGLVRNRLVRRERESAERGLGPQGAASFDETLIDDVRQQPGGALEAESLDRLKQRLIPSTETSPPSATERVPELKPAEVRPDAEVSESSLWASADERPELDRHATGVKKWVSFLRRWLYPVGHHDVVEETVDVKIAEVDHVLVSKEDEHEAALELLDGAEKEIEDLSAALSDAARDLAEARAEAASAQEEANEHSSKLAYYRKELIEARRFDALEPQPEAEEEWATPHDLHEIAALLTNDERGAQIRQYVVFTGDLAALDAVAQRDTHGHYVSVAWSFIHALYDFARLRDTGTNISMDMYLRHDAIAGHKVSVHRHAVHESDTVRKREDLRRLREFPVPTEVNPDGHVFMESHFRIGSGDGFAPRMYYYDNTGGDGRVYIGYIGRHPKNLLTN